MGVASTTYLTKIVACLYLFIVITVNGDLFPLPEFTGKDVTGSVFGAENDEIFPVAFGDLNADKLTDVVTVTKDKSSLVVFYSRQEAPYLQRGVHCNIRTEKNRTVEIVGVAPGDFTGDGLMDLAVTVEQIGTNDKELIILKGDANDVICDSGSEKVTAVMVQEPLAADFNGDMIVDLIGEAYENENDKVAKRKLWLFKDDSFTSSRDSPPPPKEIPFLFKDDEGKSHLDGFRKMTRPSSNAFLDIDDDYMPELLMVTEARDQDDRKSNKGAKFVIETYTVVVNENDKDFPVSFTQKRKDIPILDNDHHAVETIGQPLFIDLNQSGELVHILPYCSKEDCQKGSGSGLLAVINNTTIALPLQGTDYDGKKWKWKHAPHHGDENSHSSFASYYSRTISLRVGDYNLDGFPDLIGVVVSEGDTDQNTEKRAVVLENVACKTDKDKICPFPRTFNFRFDVLQNYGNVTLATFYDIHDDGLIDVFLVRRSDNSTKPSKGKFEVRAFENSPDYDSNFFKVMVLSARPCSKCPQNGIPYGNVITGPIVRYRTTTQLGERQQAIAAQNYRSSHLSLDLPYTIFGIGHSPNFVETLIVGVSPTKEENRTHEWPQIIPNSQIIVIPPLSKETGSWKFKLFLTPSDAVWKTFAVLIGVIVVVLLIVLGLQYKERKEDKMDRLQEAHRFMM